MLTFFFIIVFIAEIIITSSLISLILKLDKKVCEINKCFPVINPLVENTFTLVRININSIALALNKVQIKIAQQKDKYKTIIIKNIITFALFILLSHNAKKIISVTELAFSAADLGKALVKALTV